MGADIPAAAANIPQSDGAALMTTLNEQLGLKLESTRRNVPSSSSTAWRRHSKTSELGLFQKIQRQNAHAPYDACSMPDKTVCPTCQRIGFVRQERIIKGGDTSVAYYCGHCDHTWTLMGADARLAPRPEFATAQPDRSR